MIKEISHNRQVKGIYCIENLIDGKKYIGSAINMYRRIKQHFSSLKLNKHFSKHLQAAYNLKGKESFSYYCVEEVSDCNFLLEREQYWIDTLQVCNNKIGYNKATDVKRKSGYTICEEGRKNMSIGQKGKKYNKEDVTKRIEKIETKVYQYSLNNIFIQEFFSIRDAAISIKKDRSNISKVISKDPAFITAGGFMWKREKTDKVKDIIRWRNRPLVCIETGEIYKSVEDCIQKTGYSKISISRSVRYKKAMGGKITISKYEK